MKQNEINPFENYKPSIGEIMLVSDSYHDRVYVMVTTIYNITDSIVTQPETRYKAKILNKGDYESVDFNNNGIIATFK